MAMEEDDFPVLGRRPGKRAFDMIRAILLTSLLFALLGCPQHPERPKWQRKLDNAASQARLNRSIDWLTSRWD